MKYDILATKESIDKTIKALEEKGYTVFTVEKSSQALNKIKEIIPAGVSVMNGSSVTLEQIGYTNFIKSEKSGWDDLHAKVNAENDPVKRKQLRRQAVLSDYYLGSVHGLTEDGQMVIASNTGSQLPHIVFTSQNIIFIIGTQKIVANLEQALRRLEEYVYPLEEQHMKSLYNVGTSISKIVIFKKESKMIGRKINIILVNEKLGF